jgi:hypothetical protein
MAETQSYQNHVRKMPAHVNVLFLILLANILWSGYRMFGGLSVDSVLAFLMSVAIPWVAVVSRTQTLTVQNRVIRLEQRLRFRELLAPDVAARAAALPIAQLVSLRFASDAELPGLVNEVLSGQLALPKDIKQKVKDWQGDFLRA